MGHKGPFGAVLGHFGTITEISVKNGVWGPVEWVGDQLTGWGGPPGTKIRKEMHFVF